MKYQILINYTNFISKKSHNFLDKIISKLLDKSNLDKKELKIVNKILSYAIIILSTKQIEYKNFLGKNIIINNQEELDEIEKTLDDLEPYENIISDYGYYFIYPNCGLGNQLFMILSIFSHANKNNRKFTINKIDKSVHSNINYKDTIFSKFIFLNLRYTKRHKTHQKRISVLEYKMLDDYTINDNVFFQGYFQNENYLNNIKNNFNELLNFDYVNFNNILDYKLLDNSYFMHLRLGDYVGSDYFNILKINYYKNCIDDIIKNDKDNNINIYLFSNEINKATEIIKTNIENNNISIIPVDNLNEIESLLMMTKCKKGGIIANSTFSWWGGLMNSVLNNSQIYIPNKWFNTPECITCDMTNSKKIQYN